MSVTFSSHAQRRSAQRQVGAFHRFRELSRQLLGVNEKICPARPVEDTLTAQEKQRPERSGKKPPKK